MTNKKPINQKVKNLEGIHLYHFSRSNCSMRVRMVLEEKSIPWTSHHLDLRKAENATEEYFSIHPKGLVPTLVHDGVIHIESTDIINYLDETFPEPALRPNSSKYQQDISDWMSLAANNHIHVKAFMFSHQIGASMKKTEKELTLYRELQNNEELLQFHAENSSAEGLSENRVNNATKILKDCFFQINETLDTTKWIGSQSFSLADITWIPLYITLKNAGFLFSDFNNVKRWAEQIESKPSFQKGIKEWLENVP
ncbi:MAG: glutathione S-transferase [Rhodospirillaceae bacterium]|nr:glutathione S-transferase [Rhodospirillaceae bacterium]|tara:strand:- start:3489 stop:4250 length:762 start_codon:yes stop_codon:yes gene_type:complete